ncbi:MAG TPA: sensor histidine kinase [Candidatus Kapabacteria bacterium]|nr:sensor histidine kinase [Candidatus Kapabacteria bacterium]
MQNAAGNISNKSAESLHADYECLRRLFEHAGDAIFVHGLDGLFTNVNFAASVILGYSRKELLGMYPWNLVLRDSREQILSLWTGMTPGEPITVSDELRRKDGSTFPAEVRLVRYQRGAEDMIIAICRDISKRRRAEAAQLRAEVEIIKERNRIAREIHDSLAQSFTGILMQLEAAGAAQENGADTEVYLQRVRETAKFGLDEARRSVLALRPAVLEEEGLEQALQKLAERSSIQGSLICEFTALGFAQRLDPRKELGIFRIAQEAVGNAIKHARASRISIELTVASEQLKLSVRDDGQGIAQDIPSIQIGYGFSVMRERASELGGFIDLESSRGVGTNLSLNVPL